MIKLFNLIDRYFNIIQGVGWGSRSIKSELSSYKKYIKEGKIFVDVGGNKGIYTDEILNIFQPNEIHIFEPSIFNHNILQKKYSKNNKVIINNVGLSSSNCEAKLFADIEGSGLGSVSKRRLDHFGIQFSNEEIVTMQRFDSYWESYDNKIIDLFKIDVEGHELDVLKGIGTVIENIKIIQFEFGGCNIDSKTYFQDFWYFFKSLDFKIYRISPIGSLEIEKYDEKLEKFITTNYFCINKRFF